ncbi:MAG: TIGR04190 family B12-binding domain/radical SAM domain protein, partial [Chloroflexi bacterium]|nr:TIGR04190 family B12-binding domain/radical SAM domain protein [Chloroflexota bacterium]
FVVRGDSAEEPMLRLMRCIKQGNTVEEVPNLSWKDKNGTAHHNELAWVPSSLDDIPLDYSYPVRSVIKYRSLSSVVPFGNWMDYPITAVFTCRGCTMNCRSCGGSSFFFRQTCKRARVAYRSPALLANDIYSIQRYLNGPVFIIGDIRQPGEDYANALLQNIRRRGTAGPIVLELFAPADRSFFHEVSKAIPHYNVQMSPESHSEEVRYAFGKHWPNAGIDDTIRAAMENNCRRFDLFYMIGLPKQDRRSVMDTVDFLGRLPSEFGKSGQLHPHISPLAPFVDPGSQVFERPEEHGYRLLHHTLEDHRRALLAPAWSHMLNYETQWLSRAEIVDVTYEAALGFNESKRASGLITSQAATGVKARIERDRNLLLRLDSQRADGKQDFSEETIAELRVAATISKSELEWPAKSLVRSIPRILWNLCRSRV